MAEPDLLMWNIMPAPFHQSGGDDYACSLCSNLWNCLCAVTVTDLSLPDN